MLDETCLPLGIGLSPVPGGIISLRTSRMHDTTFDYLKPTDDQVARMQRVREAAKVFASVLAVELPDGPDKTFAIRNHRTTAMWANICITRQPDGSPRQ